jgi:hypothetical protein
MASESGESFTIPRADVAVIAANHPCWRYKVTHPGQPSKKRLKSRHSLDNWAKIPHITRLPSLLGRQARLIF